MLRESPANRRLRKALLAAGIVGLLIMLGAGLDVGAVDRPHPAPTAEPAGGSPPAADTPAPTPTPTPTPAARPLASFATLQAELTSLAQGQGDTIALTLIELAGPQPRTWSLNGDRASVAASEYKLPLLMAEAQGIAAGTLHPGDRLCYVDSDYEDGWFDDYADGACFSRSELDQRVGVYSDNTAAHMLVRAMGGGAALNAYASAHGAGESEFYEPNTTTSADLGRLWADEVAGRAGGPAAQSYLYPLLTHTQSESGIPAGLPADVTVVHKVGELDEYVNDAGYVANGPAGGYILTVVVDEPAGDGWSLIAQASQLVWAFEAGR